MIKSTVSALLVLSFSVAALQHDPSAVELAARIEKAHGIDKLRSHQAIEADITVDFGDMRLVEGTIVFTTDGGRSRITSKAGTVFVFDGERAWVSPASANAPMARFHLLTWPYFALAPYKLRDPGTNLAATEPLPLDGKPHPTAKLTFAPGTGDAPDDWYILYSDPDSGRLVAMAYIVTYGTKPENVEEPHAIVYKDFETIDGVTISTTWDFFHWSVEKGPHGEPMGKATLRNVKFVTPEPGTFDKPADAKEDPLPKP